ncbi:hypothetical protein [Endozoicomonas numazuensis]|uniref:Uncharacterized protein n=1 Tax=Endozoicomonas numazuensis TaxID=1137799 RepID=A0A081N023_9GAMM|nr:hypothetical protein [Endozoicomonas numazuensis]KEQ11796.1 hypothetical protein GZ78_28530 [Endozoicomonas numazuensis]
MVNEKVIGNKYTFAINYEIESVSPSIMGRVCLWVGNTCIGTIDDTNLLSVTLYQLKKMNPVMLDGTQFRGLKESQIYQTIKSDNNLELDRYFMSFGESFDDFSIVAYFLDGFMCFIWILLDHPFFTYINYPKDIQFAKVPINVFSEVIAQFEDELTHSVTAQNS